MKSSLNRLTTAFMAAGLLVAQVLMPVQAAYAGTLKPVYCNVQGQSGTWKAQISAGNTEHEALLKKSDGSTYMVEDQSQVTPQMDALCQAQYGTPTVVIAPVACTTGTNSTDDVTVKVTNAASLTAGVTYTVVVGAQTKTTNLLVKNAFQTLTFSGLSAGTHTVTVTGSDGTSYTSTVTVGACTAPTQNTVPAPTATTVVVCGPNNDTYTLSGYDSTKMSMSTPAWVDGSMAITFTITAAGYTFTDGTTTATVTLKDAATACPTAAPCTASTGNAFVTTKEQFATATLLNDQRADGAYEFTTDGLHIRTTLGGSTSKIAWYNDVADYPLSQVGVPSMTYDKLPTGVTNPDGTERNTVPGMQLAIDFDGNGTFDGILVGESVYVGTGGAMDWWLPDSAMSQAFVKAGAPRTDGGFGSQYHGTINEWLAKFPSAKVMAVGFSLGSGVIGNGTLVSLTAGCYTWTFGKEDTQVEQPTAPVFTDATCKDMATVTIPENDFYYTISWNGHEEEYAEAGTYEMRSPSTVVVRAYTSGDSEELVLVTEWTHEFKSPAGCTPGTGNTTPPVTPVTPVTPRASNPVASSVLPALLPETGGMSMNGTVVALAAALATYGAVYFAVNKRRYE